MICNVKCSDGRKKKKEQNLCFKGLQVCQAHKAAASMQVGFRTRSLTKCRKNRQPFPCRDFSVLGFLLQVLFPVLVYEAQRKIPKALSGAAPGSTQTVG